MVRILTTRPTTNWVERAQIALNGIPMSVMTQLWDVTSCHMGLFSVTCCYPTQVNAPALTPARKRILDLPISKGWKAELAYGSG